MTIHCDEALLQVRVDRRKVTAFGLLSGKDGPRQVYTCTCPAANIVSLKQQVSARVKNGTMVTCITCRWRLRQPFRVRTEQLLEDVVNEKFTVDYIKGKYGVVIDEKNKQSDVAATVEVAFQLRGGIKM